MSILPGKGCGVSLRLSPEFGGEQGCCKDKCECIPHFSQMPAFSRGKHTVNKPRWGVNIPEGPVSASSLMLSLLCPIEQALYIVGNLFPQ